MLCVATVFAALAAAVTAAPSSKRQSTQGSANYCGAPNSYEVISDTPWIVFSMNYNYQDIVGSACTGYVGLSGSGSDQMIHWNSTWDISPSTQPGLVKGKQDWHAMETSSTRRLIAMRAGYSFIGLTQGLENRLSDIASIPAKYHWIRDNQTQYEGNVVFDFMTSDTKGDSTSTSAQELMLWLRYEGGQVPIGYSSGPVATINGLYGKDGWRLYQGKNTATGITVSSLVVPSDNQYYGNFDGDVKDWLSAMSEQGIFSTSTYVNVGNAGMEPFHGTVNFVNTLNLRINLS